MIRTLAQWEALDRAAQAAGFYQFTMSAEENAQSTIHEEKAASPEEFAELAFGSLEGLLAFSDDEAAIQFFAKHGVKA